MKTECQFCQWSNKLSKTFYLTESSSLMHSVFSFFDFAGRMDIDVSLVEDCRRLAKQCKMADLIEELENKCKHVYEFGKTVLLAHFFTSNLYYK